MSPILVMLTSHTDSNFERSNISFKENKHDDVDPNSTVSTMAFERKKEVLRVFGRLKKLSLVGPTQMAILRHSVTPAMQVRHGGLRYSSNKSFKQDI